MRKLGFSNYGRNGHPQEFGLSIPRKERMHFRVKHCLAGLVLLALTMPVWARAYKETVTLGKDITIGSAQLKSGTYEFTADDTKKELNILQKGKIIATVQGQWVKLPQKALFGGIDSQDDKISRVRFGGSKQAFQLP